MAVSTLQGYIELRHSSFLPCGPRRGVVCRLPRVVMKKIKMGGRLIGRYLCCLECGLIGEGEAMVADEGGDGEGENAMVT